MGGLFALALAERNPELHDGALPTCGVMGGTDMLVQREIDRFGCSRSGNCNCGSVDGAMFGRRCGRFAGM